MSLAQQATDILNGLKSEPQPQNVYWYGWGVVNGDAAPEPRGPILSPPYRAVLSQLQPPYAIGWQDPEGSPLVGTYGPDNTTIAFTDCSGFVAWVLRSQSPSAYAAISAQVKAINDQELRNYLSSIDQQHGQNWPSAADYAVLGMSAAFTTPPLQALGGNENLPLSTLEPGDILAWGLSPGDSDTGHVVFVANPPRENSDGTWSIDVVDSSVLKHSQDDRPGGTGVGQGTITLQPREGTWWINFDATDSGFHFRPSQYLSALRVTI